MSIAAEYGRFILTATRRSSYLASATTDRPYRVISFSQGGCG
jgi:hypothetical protein